MLTKHEKVGFTAMIIAAMKGYTDTVRELINNGADVNAKDKEGKTAIMMAESNGHKIISFCRSIS